MTTDFLLGSILGALTLAIGLILGNAIAAQLTDPSQSVARGFSTQGTAGEADDTLPNAGYYNGTTWERWRGTADISTTGGNNQQTLSTTSAAVPTTALSGRFRICVFSNDASINSYCKIGTTAATTTNASLVTPRAGRCFRTTQALQCIAASGSPVIDYEEYGP